MKPILTVGYGSRSLLDILDLLSRESVEFLVDVRSNPVSKFRPDFSRQLLSEALESACVKYVFMGDLLGGRPPDPTCYSPNGRVIYELVRERSFFQKGLSRLHKAFMGGNSVCLLCSEGKPEDCHRAKLIGVSLEEMGVPVFHLDSNGAKVPHRQVMERLDSAQGEMFGIELRSRKAYGRNTPVAKKKR